jgi:hypothetical protein
MGDASAHWTRARTPWLHTSRVVPSHAVVVSPHVKSWTDVTPKQPRVPSQFFAEAKHRA